MKIGIVSGSVNSLPLLQFLNSNKIEVCFFSDQIEQNRTDMEMIKHFCKTVNIAVEESLTLYQWLSAINPEIIFILGFRQLIDISKIPAILNSKIFNIHFGALPDYRGPNPVFWQLKNGLEKVTLSIHKINNKFDDGEVVWSKQVLNEPHFTFGYLELLFAQVAIEGVSYIINQILQFGKLPQLQKVNSISRYYKRPELKDVMIQWANTPAIQIVNLINACNPWNKGATTFYNGNEVKIIDAEILYEKIAGDSVPGTIINHQGCLHIACLDKNILSVNMLNISGTFLPGRFANKLGFTTGGVLTTL